MNKNRSKLVLVSYKLESYNHKRGISPISSSCLLFQPKRYSLYFFVKQFIGCEFWASKINNRKCLAVDSDEGARAVESSSSQALVLYEADSILEPYEGMEFESEDAAKIFYDEYARRVGFVMRVMSCRRSERDGRILARRLGCNKEGHCVSIRGKFGPVRKPRASTREGCKAMIHVKYDKSSKWVITKFIKDHNHPLVVSPREARQTMVSIFLIFSNIQ